MQPTAATGLPAPNSPLVHSPSSSRDEWRDRTSALPRERSSASGPALMSGRAHRRGVGRFPYAPAEGESAAAAGEVVSAGEICGRGRSAPRRERHPAAVPSRAWRRPPMRQWQIEWLSVAVLSRWLATIERPRASRSYRSPIAWAARRRRSRRTSTTRRREGTGGQGALPGGVPRLWRVHAAAQREGRRLRVLQGLPSGRDRAALDARQSARRDACVARAIPPVAVLVRLVSHARSPPRGRRARAPRRR